MDTVNTALRSLSLPAAACSFCSLLCPLSRISLSLTHLYTDSVSPVEEESSRSQQSYMPLSVYVKLLLSSYLYCAHNIVFPSSCATTLGPIARLRASGKKRESEKIKERETVLPCNTHSVRTHLALGAQLQFYFSLSPWEKEKNTCSVEKCLFSQ